MTTLFVRLRLERYTSLGKSTKISRKQIVNFAIVLAMIFVPGLTAQKAQTSEVNKLPVEEPTNIQILNSNPSDFVESYQRQKDSQQQSTSNLDEHSPFFKWNSLLKNKIIIGDKKEGFRVNYNDGNVSSNPTENQNCSFEVVDKFFQPDHLVETLVVSVDNKIFEILPKDFNLATGYSENSAFEVEVTWSPTNGIQSLFVSYLDRSRTGISQTGHVASGCIFYQEPSESVEKTQDSVDFF